ncbi:hypothetical protein TSUD_329910 [Trifolium subterraneum]|nr:hypothetical protein TSUD_329910 [Trifolium subterraneum]
MKPHFNTVVNQSIWLIGNGERISYWNDNWLGKPLVDLLQIPRSIAKRLHSSVADMIADNVWIIPNYISDVDANISYRIFATVLPITQVEDRFVWKDSMDGLLTSKIAYEFLFPLIPNPNWTVKMSRPVITSSSTVHSLLPFGAG